MRMPQSSSMEILQRKTIPQDEWDAVVYSSADGWAWALSAWQDMILSVPKWNLQDHSFAIRNQGKIVAIIPLQYQPEAKLMSSTGWGWTGPVCIDGLTKKQVKKLQAFIYTHIQDLCHSVGADKYLQGTPPVVRKSIENRWGVNSNIIYGLKDVSTHSKVLDLSVTEETLWSGLSADARQQIKKAEKAGYDIQHCIWLDHIDSYYDLHCETYNRTGVPPHPKEYFSGIASLKSTKNHNSLWVAISPEGERVAYHNTNHFDRGAIYLTGCSATKHMNSGINYLLVWRAILGAKEAGIKWYEIGEIFPAAENPKQRTLSLFKSKFGGDIHRYFKSEIEFRQTEYNSANQKKILIHNWLRSSKHLLTELIGSKHSNIVKKILCSIWNPKTAFVKLFRKVKKNILL